MSITRVPLQSVVVSRNNRAFTPPIGEPFEFTREEVEQISQMAPTALSREATIDLDAGAKAERQAELDRQKKEDEAEEARQAEEAKQAAEKKAAAEKAAAEKKAGGKAKTEKDDL